MIKGNVMECFFRLCIIYSIILLQVSADEKPLSTIKPAIKECKDTLVSNYCEILKRNGACVTNVKRMTTLCVKTCRFCEEDCVDILPRLCPWWQAHYACYTHPIVMEKNCRKSCGKCRTSAPPKPKCATSKFGCCWDKSTPKGPNGECPECKDHLRLCRRFQRDCFYGRNRKFMLQNCPRTCRQCKWA